MFFILKNYPQSTSNFGKKQSFYYEQYEGTKVFHALPIELLSLTSGILFKKVIK